jgi:hypothetical protein
MKNKVTKILLVGAIILGSFTSCVNESSYDEPQNTLQTTELTTTKTVAEIAAIAGSTPVQYTDDDVIEAYVTSNDEAGTFYKSISFQDKLAADGTLIGFSVPINATTLFGKGFTPGRKVYIKLKDLYIAKVYGSLQIGTLYNGTIGRISEFDYKKHLFVSSDVVSEDTLVRTLTLAQAYTDANQNTLVDLSVVEFSDSSLERTYYDVDSGGGATNHYLSSSAGGTDRIIRFSSFALFTVKQVPSGSGTIRGVLTKYNSDFQFIVRYESDIKLDGPRFDVYPAFVGNANVFSGTVNENFTSYALNLTNFPKYINDASLGSRYWQIKNFSSNNYIEMSAYNGASNPGLNVKTYFFVPVDFTAANNFTFKKEIRYNAGPALKVYYVTADKYTAGDQVVISNFTDITPSFNISYPAIGSSENSFSTAGTYSIPASLTGNGYFVFEYVGNAEITTTVQIDDILIN